MKIQKSKLITCVVSVSLAFPMLAAAGEDGWVTGTPKIVRNTTKRWTTSGQFAVRFHNNDSLQAAYPECDIVYFDIKGGKHPNNQDMFTEDAMNKAYAIAMTAYEMQRPIRLYVTFPSETEASNYCAMGIDPQTGNSLELLTIVP